MRLYSPARQLRLIHCVWVVFSVFFVCLGTFFFVDSLDWQAEAAEIQKDKTSSRMDEADFSQSVMLGPAQKVREGDTIDYEIILRNTGSERPEYIDLWSPVDSTSALLASAPELSFNAEDRVLHWRGTVDPGEGRRFTVKLVTLPKSATTWVLNRAWINWGSGNKDFVVETEIHSELRPSRFILPGGYGIGWAEIIILTYLLFSLLFLISVPRVIRSRETRRFETSRVPPRIDSFWDKMIYVAFLASIAFLLVYAGIVVEDIRMFASYEKTTCTILDKKIKGVAGSTRSSRGTTTYLDPLVAVRFIAGGKERFAAGSIAGGSFLSGGEKSAIKKLDRYELGKSYPCWFDPEDPHVFVLTRSLSWSWYLLGMAPLLLFLISLRYLAKRFFGPKASNEGLPSPPIK
jgi:hypothetical protein